ncbi:MAG: C45 family autoproteolytic acyltransferase/hydrolase [Promethearchaeota archaeon]
MSVPPFRLEGTPREMGLRQGSEFRDKVAWLFGELTSSEEFLRAKPRVVPRRLFTWLARRFASSMVEGAIRAHLPAQWEFLEGLAEGAGLRTSKVLFLQAIDSLGSQLRGYEVPGPGEMQCGAAGVTGRYSETGLPLIVKNWDGPASLAEVLVFRHIVPTDEGRFETVGSGVCALVGVNNGMNSKGLSVAYNYGFPVDAGRRGIPPMFLVREALELCTTVDETFELIRDFPLLGGALFLVGDGEGDLAVIEACPGRVEIRRPSPNETGAPGSAGDAGGFLVMTNHYLTQGLRELEVPRDAVYGPKAPAGVRGRRVHESSLARYRDAAAALEGAPLPVTLEYLREQVQQNHGPAGVPSATTFCNHGPDVSTGFGMAFDVAGKRVLAAVGKPCEAEMLELHQF